MSLTKKISLRQDEEIIQLVRLYNPLIAFVYLFGVLFILASSFFMFWLFAHGWWGYTLFGLGLFIGFYIILHTWYFHFANFWVITTERVVDVNRRGWLDEIISSVIYSDIKDVSVRKRGLLANLFNYGSVALETKSQQVILEMTKAHNPQKLLSTILELAENYKDSANFESQKNLYNKFIKIIPNLTEAELCEVSDLISYALKNRE